MNLSGEFADEAQEALDDLHRAEVEEKKIIVGLRSLNIKLAAIEMVIAHTNFNYSGFSEEVEDGIITLRDKLEALEKKENHFFLELEAAEKKGAVVDTKAIKLIKKEIVKFKKSSKTALKK